MAAPEGRARTSDVGEAVPAPRAFDEEGMDVTEIAPSSSISPMGGSAPNARPTSVAERLKKRGEKDPRVGQVLLGRYRLEKPIAKGGMGRVYLATQLQLGRSVAVKVLNAEFRDTDPQFVRRFGIEASICARLSHPNVVTVHDYGESEAGELFMAMELLRGRTLSAAIQKEAPFPPSRTIHIALQISRALREAHAAGIIHRDLKPGNVMLVEAGDDPDFVKVLDFGLVKLFVPEGQAVGLPVDEGDLTRAGTLLGSPRYMSPEQIRGETLDPRTDIYSFGILMFQMAAGRPPFTGSGSVDLIYKHIHEKPPRVSEVAHTECPPELEDLIQRCLEKDRDKRLGSMTELISALKHARQSITGIIERPPTDTGPLVSPRSATSAVSNLPSAPPLRADDPTKSGMLTSLPPPRATPAAEAAFADAAGGLLPLAVDPSRSVSMPRPSRWPIVLGLVGVFASAAILAAIALRRPAEAPAPPPAEAPELVAAPREIVLEFRSEPPGATVRSSSVVLGVTPFSARFVAAPDDPPRSFVAELDGYATAATEQRLDASRFVMLLLNKAEPTPSEAAPLATDDETAEPSPSASGSKKRTATQRRNATSKRRTARDPEPETEEESDATDDPDGDKKKPARYRTNPY